MKHARWLLLAALAAGCRSAPPPMPAAPPPDRTPEQLEADLEFTERQIRELYGPLAFLCNEGRISIVGFLKVLGRDFIFPTDGTVIQGADRKAWLFWAENDLFYRNEKIRNLIKTKAHLIEGTRVPPTFALLLEHQQSWAMLHTYWKEEKVEYPLHSQTSWPGLFNKEVFDTYAALKKRHADLLRELSAEGTTAGQRAAERKFVERQLRELYGPLAALNAEGTVSYHSFLRGLGRGAVFPKEGKLPEAELKKWLFWVEHDFFPRNQKRWRLISSKTHLLDGESIPKSTRDFLDHHHNWKMEHQYWREEEASYSWQARSDFPKQFLEDVAKSYARLKARHAELLGRPVGKIELPPKKNR